MTIHRTCFRCAPANGVFAANATLLTANGFAVNSTGAYVTGLVNATSYNTGAGYGSATGGAVVNVTTIAVGNATVNGTITSNTTVTYFTGTAYTANNATNLGGVAAASYVNTSGSYTLSGTITHSGNTIFTNWVNLKTYIENASSPAISASALTLDLSNTTVFTVNLNSNITTLTISNAPATTNAVSGFVVIFTADGTARSVTWPSTTPNVRWANGTAPTLKSTNNKRDVLTFFTTDNGSTYNAFISGQNL